MFGGSRSSFSFTCFSQNGRDGPSRRYTGSEPKAKCAFLGTAHFHEDGRYSHSQVATVSGWIPNIFHPKSPSADPLGRCLHISILTLDFSMKRAMRRLRFVIMSA
jgi:hypothetical protein